MRAQPQCVRSNLGLVCITTTDAVRYKTITRKRLLSFDAAEQSQRLRELYAANASRLENAIEFCEANGIKLYRISSGIFPFSDEDLGRVVLDEFTERLAGSTSEVSMLACIWLSKRSCRASSGSRGLVPAVSIITNW